jgi:predicted ATP-dependent endonuclease of OLD family
MSEIRLEKIKVKNYRSFGEEQIFCFPGGDYLKPVSIIGYNNSGKTNLMNAILYGVGEKFVNASTFEKADLHKLDYRNNIEIKTKIKATSYKDSYGSDKTIEGVHQIITTIEDNEIKSSCQPSFFGANKHYNIFYINFHKIKDEISLKKTSWGSLRSFLGKHLKSIVESDSTMNSKKQMFERDTKIATDKVLQDSSLSQFIDKIRDNYSRNLRDNNCEIEFGLPDYEDIFLQMIFKIGLNGDTNNLMLIDHFGDGYISMFVMAIIQSIAESNLADKCLFLFEEPESFLHENHQEYFYKMVLCRLAQKGHQVIYTTHSDKMIDIFDTRSIIRIEFCEKSKSTAKKYNNIDEFNLENNIISITNFNSYIKSVEPNLNKIIFSRKVVLVEGSNDLMSYNFAIEKIVNQKTNDESYSKSYLNFKNISIVVHHGKITVLLLIELCKHFGIDYFVITDWDFEDNFIQILSEIQTEDELKINPVYLENNGIVTNPTQKGMITTNWKLIYYSNFEKIHFNVPKLESVLDHKSDDKNSLKLWETLIGFESFPESFFPNSLANFLEINNLTPVTSVS